mgnify:CR=1 FL=1
MRALNASVPFECLRCATPAAFEDVEAVLCGRREKWCSSRDDCFEILQEKLYSLFTKRKLQYLHYKHYKDMPQCC